MIIDLIDGTYELFRHFYGLRRFTKGDDRPFGAVAGVLNGVLEMIEREVTHVGVATDHVIESFRNRLWPGYKTGDELEAASLFKQLATLRTDAKLFRDVEALRWRGPTRAFAAWTESVGAPKILERALQAHESMLRRT